MTDIAVGQAQIEWNSYRLQGARLVNRSTGLGLMKRSILQRVCTW